MTDHSVRLHAGERVTVNDARHLVHSVPAGTKASTCSGHTKGGTCRATIYWIKVASRQRDGSTKTAGIPIDCDTIEGSGHPSVKESATQFDGVGVSHFVTCVDRKLFSRNAP